MKRILALLVVLTTGLAALPQQPAQLPAQPTDWTRLAKELRESKTVPGPRKSLLPAPPPKAKPAPKSAVPPGAGTEGPPTIVVGSEVDQKTATSNRVIMESQKILMLPVGTVAMDRGFIPMNNQTILGAASIINKYTYDFTVRMLGEGLGYLDYLTVTAENEVTMQDPAAIDNYPIGGPAYFYHVDGFMDGTGSQLRTLRTVIDKKDGVLTVDGPPLDKRLTGGKWFEHAMAVGDVKAGQTKISVANPTFAVGDWVLLTEGPSVANEGRDEWHQVIEVNPKKGVRLDSAIFRDYKMAVLAVARPLYGVTFKDTTFLRPPSTVSMVGACFLKYANYCRFENVTVTGTDPDATGDLWMAGCSHCIFVNCTIDHLALNSCHDCTFTNCRFKTAWMEECCFNMRYEGCAFSEMWACNTQCESLIFTGSKILGPQGYVGMDANNAVIDGCTMIGGQSCTFLLGDGVRVVNTMADAYIWFQYGTGAYFSNTRCPMLALGNGGTNKTTGTVLNCPNVDNRSGTWVVFP